MENSDHEKRTYGPTLPPNIQNFKDASTKCESVEYFGPKLPPYLQQKQEEQLIENCNLNDDIAEDMITVGPLPPTVDSTFNKQHKDLEERALEIKIRSISEASTSADSKDKIREEWMIELPDLNKSGLGIFARQFRKRAGPDMSDRTIWTDTPNTKTKPKKITEKEIEKTKFDYEKDKEQDALLKKHKKKHKRDKSLMEIHSKKMKKEKKKKDKEKDKTVIERRPFNREEDLQVNRFDQARKQAVIKKAQQLDSRFSTGKSKYL